MMSRSSKNQQDFRLSKAEAEEKLRNILFAANRSRTDPFRTLKSSIVFNRRVFNFRNEVNLEKEDPENYKISKELEIYFKDHKIVTASTKSKKVEKNYRCGFCKNDVGTLQTTLTHIATKGHIKCKLQNSLEYTIQYLPDPTANHLAALEKFLQSTAVEVGLSDEDLDRRAQTAEKFNKIFPDCIVELFGSSKTGFGLKTSDVNLNLRPTDPNQSGQQLITNIYNQIKEKEEFKYISSDFRKRFPSVTFMFDGFRCRANVFDETAQVLASLLGDYFKLDPRVRVLAANLQHWAKLCLLSSPDNGTFPAQAFPILLVYFLQRREVLPCLHEKMTDKTSETYQTPTLFISKYKSTNKTSLPKLWIDFFKFFSTDFNIVKSYVCIRSSAIERKKGTKWESAKCHVIEDPSNPNLALSSSVNTRNLNFFQFCFQLCYSYFSIPMTKDGPVFTELVESKDESDSDSSIEHIQSRGSSPFDVITLDELEAALDKVDLSQDNVDSKSKDPSVAKFGGPMTKEEALMAAKTLSSEDFVFKYDVQRLTLSEKPILICKTCDKDGHVDSTCPDGIMPSKKDLPPLSARKSELLKKLCEDILTEKSPKKEEMEHRDLILKKLLKVIQQELPNAHLEMIGSSCNGFALTGSDMDFCLTFEGNESPPTNTDSIKIIQTIAKQLRKNPQTYDQIVAIISAKVPIVKFVDINSNLEGDISFYNVLGRENTRMIKFYSTIDQRFKILGYVLKLYAKTCDIGDASKGSLSSYAYILMLIHYLQHACQTPVLPVLQEMYTGPEQPVKKVEDWNAWFYSDPKGLKKEWKEYGQNKQSISELWIGFLGFYAFDFEYDNDVVCIRKSQRLLKSEKSWMGKSFAIEDPFNLAHNLASGLSRRMHMYIVRSFATSWEHFLSFPDNHNNLKKYLLDHTRLVGNKAPPRDGCLICHNIGHYVRDCPLSRKRKPEDRGKDNRPFKNNGNRREVKDGNRQVQNGIEKTNLGAVPKTGAKSTLKPSEVPKTVTKLAARPSSGKSESEVPKTGTQLASRPSSGKSESEVPKTGTKHASRPSSGKPEREVPKTGTKPTSRRGSESDKNWNKSKMAQAEERSRKNDGPEGFFYPNSPAQMFTHNTLECPGSYPRSKPQKQQAVTSAVQTGEKKQASSTTNVAMAQKPAPSQKSQQSATGTNPNTVQPKIQENAAPKKPRHRNKKPKPVTITQDSADQKQ